MKKVLLIGDSVLSSQSYLHRFFALWRAAGLHPTDVTGEPHVAHEGTQPALSGVVERLESGSSPVRIVCFGDSITGVYYHTGGRRAWCDVLGVALQKLYPKAQLELYNAGISGQRTDAGLARIDRDVIAYKPHLVVVMFGMNDSVAANAEHYQENLKVIVRRCHKAGAAVVLCTPNSIYPEDKQRFANLPAHVDAVRTLADEMAVPLADCYLAYENLRALNPLAWKLLMSETIHPSMNGHRFFAQTIAKTISGKQVMLNVLPPPSGFSFTFDCLSRKQPVKLIAMSPYDTILPNMLRAIFPDAIIDVVSWPLGTLGNMEQWSKDIRSQNPTLVVVAVPGDAQAPTHEAFIRSYNWILNWSLAFTVAAWDTIAILPSVTTPKLTSEEALFADLAKRVIAGKDMVSVTRQAGDASDPGTILQRVIEAEYKTWGRID